jgi:hypothetical protein
VHGVQPLTQIRSVFEDYARRGIFRSYSEVASGRFRFHWLWNAPFAASFDRALVFEGMLPDADPATESTARAFLAECCAPERREHRRLDPRKLRATWSKRRGGLTLRVAVKDGDWDAGARRALQFVNELFTAELSLKHPEYLARVFRVPEE